MYVNLRLLIEESLIVLLLEKQMCNYKEVDDKCHEQYVYYVDPKKKIIKVSNILDQKIYSFYT